MFFIARTLLVLFAGLPMIALADSQELVMVVYKVDQKHVMDFDGLKRAPDQNSFAPKDLHFKYFAKDNRILFAADFKPSLDIVRSTKADPYDFEATTTQWVLTRLGHMRDAVSTWIESISGEKQHYLRDDIEQQVERFYNTRPNRLAQVAYETLAEGIDSHQKSANCLSQAQKRNLDLLSCEVHYEIFDADPTLKTISIEVSTVEPDGKTHHIANSFVVSSVRYRK